MRNNRHLHLSRKYSLLVHCLSHCLQIATHPSHSTLSHSHSALPVRQLFNRRFKGTYALVQSTSDQSRSRLSGLARILASPSLLLWDTQVDLFGNFRQTAIQPDRSCKFDHRVSKLTAINVVGSVVYKLEITGSLELMLPRHVLYCWS